MSVPAELVGRRKSRRGALVQGIITIGLVALLVYFVDWKAVLPVLRQVSLGWSGLILVLVLVERLVLNIKWQALLSVGGIDIGFWKLFRIQLAANALGIFLPSSIGVDALRIAGLWHHRDRRHEAVAATLLDRVTTALATVCVGGLMIVLVAGSLVGQKAVSQALIAGVLAVVIVIAGVSPPGRRLIKSMIRRLPAALRDRLMQIGAATLLIAGHRRSIAVTVLTSLGAVGLRIVIGKCLLLACGAEVPLSALAFILPIVWATTMLPISIGGIGVQDAAYVVLLGYVGVGSAVAIVVSLLDHILSRLPVAIGVLFWKDVMPARQPDAGTPDP